MGYIFELSSQCVPSNVRYLFYWNELVKGNPKRQEMKIPITKEIVPPILIKLKSGMIKECCFRKILNICIGNNNRCFYEKNIIAYFISEIER